MTFTDDIVGQPPGIVGQTLASALLGRLPALTDELLKCVLKQADACGNHSDIHGDDRPVPIDDLYQSLQDKQAPSPGQRVSQDAAEYEPYARASAGDSAAESHGAGACTALGEARR